MSVRPPAEKKATSCTDESFHSPSADEYALSLRALSEICSDALRAIPPETSNSQLGIPTQTEPWPAAVPVKAPSSLNGIPAYHPLHAPSQVDIPFIQTVIPSHPLPQATEEVGPVRQECPTPVITPTPIPIPVPLLTLAIRRREYAMTALSRWRVIFLLDDSTEMLPHWEDLSNTVASAVSFLKDPTGVDIHFLNNKNVNEGVKTARHVKGIFSTFKPKGPVPIGYRLFDILNTYAIALREHGIEKMRPIHVICITRGKATDDPESTIQGVNASYDRLHAPAWQAGVTFCQVGADPLGTELLQAYDSVASSWTSNRDLVLSTPPCPKGVPSITTVMRAVFEGMIRRGRDGLF